MGKVGIYIEHGVEMRHFFLSGLSKEFNRLGDEVVLLVTKEPNSLYFKEYIRQEGLETIVLDSVVAQIKDSKWETRLRSVRDAKKKNSSLPTYRHYANIQNPGTLATLAASNSMLYKWFHFYSLLKIKKHYAKIKIVNHISGLNLCRIILLEYGSGVRSALGHVANKLGIRIDVYLNTLKTIYINDLITFRPDNLYCWTKEHAEIIEIANWYHKPGFTKPIGSPFHTYLRDNDEVEIMEVCNKYGIEEGRKLIVYSLIFEKIYLREHLIIEKIYNQLAEWYSDGEMPYIVIRRNPFEESSVGVEYLKNNCPEIIICDHYWERDVKNGWSIQGVQGEKEWRGLLYRANMLLNIPSMATIDAMMVNTATGNVFVNEDNQYNEEVKHILKSPFTNIFLNNPGVVAINTLDDLKKLIHREQKKIDISIETAKLEAFSS